jgi:hypothetical protein
MGIASAMRLLAIPLALSADRAGADQLIRARIATAEEILLPTILVSVDRWLAL